MLIGIQDETRWLAQLEQLKSTDKDQITGRSIFVFFLTLVRYCMGISFFDKFKKTVSDATDMVSQTWSNAVDSVSQTVSDAVDSVSQTVSDLLVDTSDMTWEERVDYYKSRETTEGYAEALRLMDLHTPEDEGLVEIWNEALKKHPELALEIYNHVLVTNKSEIWHKIYDIHTVALNRASTDQKKAIKEVIASIEYYKFHDVNAGKEKLAFIFDYDSEQMDLAANGCWERLELKVMNNVKSKFYNQDEISKEVGHALANYAESAADPDRAIEFLSKYIHKAEKDLTLRWRLAILYRDLKRWDDYIYSLKKLGIYTEKQEDKLDIYYELIRVYHEILHDDSKMEKLYSLMLDIDPSNDDAINYLIANRDQNQSWNSLIDQLEANANTLTSDIKKSNIYLRIGEIHQECLHSSKTKCINYYEKALELNDQNQNAIDNLKQLYKEDSQWDKLLLLLDKEIDIKDKTSEDKVAIYKEKARIYRIHLKNKEENEKCYKLILKLIPNDREAFDYLSHQYRRSQNWFALISIWENRAKLDDEKEKFGSYSKLAEICINKDVNLQSDAIKYYEKCLEIKPDYEEAINQLKDIYTKEKDWKNLLSVNRKALALLKDINEQIDLLRKMAFIASNNLNDDDNTIEMWGLILDRDLYNIVTK